MNDKVPVLVLGAGQMGGGIARLVDRKPGLDLVCVHDRQTGEDLATLVANNSPAIAIQATCSRLEDALPDIRLLLRRGVNVISIAEQMAWPAASSPAAARELQELAAENGVSILGTGINPGFVLDLLVITLSGVCASIDSIRATRVNDLSPYGPTVLHSQGVGLSPESFREGLAEAHGWVRIAVVRGQQVGWARHVVAFHGDVRRHDREPWRLHVERPRERVRRGHRRTGARTGDHHHVGLVG